MEKRALLLIILTIALSSSAIGQIELQDPAFGRSQALDFDVSIVTDQEAQCRYSSPFQKPYEEMSNFDTTGLTHNVGFSVPVYDTDFEFYVDCETSREVFQLQADSKAPIIQVRTNPTMIVQKPAKTTLIIETNEPTSCKYDYETSDYDAMQNSVIGSDTLATSYQTYQEKILTELIDPSTYNVKVSCKDLSGRLGNGAVTFSVNTQSQPIIESISPANAKYLINQNVILTVKTNKQSTCKYGTTNPPIENDGSYSILGKVHSVNLWMQPGKHTYYFACTFEGPKIITAQSTFTIDITPPTSIKTNVEQGLAGIQTGYTYRDDDLRIAWDAEDADSEIKLFNYSIYNQNNVMIKNWTSTSRNKITASNLNLQDQQRYFFLVMAQNNAGLWSDVTASEYIIVDFTLNQQLLCSNNRLDPAESDLDCGGECKKCSINRLCDFSEDCQSGTCINNRCALSSCNDGIKNADETDTDCGGSCRTCLAGESCMLATDCLSGQCNQGTCLSKGLCENSVKDILETDIDCGGICAEAKGIKCSIGKSCGKNIDCKSNTCGSEGKCTSHDDQDGDGIKNSDDNCPLISNNEQEDSDLDGRGDVCDEDSDDDGLPDEWENKYGLDSLSVNNEEDEDADGLTNYREYMLGTNPKSKDSDNDGYEDAFEVMKGSDPTDAKSKPKNRILTIAIWAIIFLIGATVFGIYYYNKVRANVKVARKELDEKIAMTTAQPKQKPEPKKEFIPSPPTPPPKQFSQPPPSHSIADRKIDELRKIHDSLSGEEIFDKIKRQARKEL